MEASAGDGGPETDSATTLQATAIPGMRRARNNPSPSRASGTADTGRARLDRKSETKRHRLRCELHPPDPEPAPAIAGAPVR
jgi:hypothetical protein